MYKFVYDNIVYNCHSLESVKIPTVGHCRNRVLRNSDILRGDGKEGGSSVGKKLEVRLSLLKWTGK